MKRFLAVVLTACSLNAGASALTGAGATFPAPVYAKWAELYNKETKVAVNYSAIGSSGGIKQIDTRTVDFGATDDPVSEAQLKAKNQYQFPTVIGGVVPVINIRGVAPGQIVLDGKTLADIFEGRVRKWTDPAIVRLNPNIKFPDKEITLAVRADGSGTTAVFTDYLSQVSASFKQTVGAGKTVSFKGNTVAGKGNAGVAAFVKQIDGAIGYVEYAYVKTNKLTHVALKNRQGRTVQPDDTTFAEAARSADWNVPGMAVNLNNRDGWPITSATFVIVYTDGAKSKEVVKFFDWAFAKGDQAALELEYVPLPNNIKNQIRTNWARNIK